MHCLSSNVWQWGHHLDEKKHGGSDGHDVHASHTMPSHTRPTVEVHVQ